MIVKDYIETAAPPAGQIISDEIRPTMFVVWIDDTCGFGPPNWEIDNPPPYPEEPLQKALAHAAHTRSLGYPSVLMLPGQSPRADGSIDREYRK